MGNGTAGIHSDKRLTLVKLRPPGGASQMFLSMGSALLPRQYNAE
jgi:hypothetical protein